MPSSSGGSSGPRRSSRSPSTNGIGHPSPVSEVESSRGEGRRAVSPIVVSSLGMSGLRIAPDSPIVVDEAPAGDELAGRENGRIVTAGAELRSVQMEERFGDERRARVRECIEGRCGRTDPKDMRCLGCECEMHGVLCASISRGFASLGVFRCALCRLRAQFPTAGADHQFSQAAVRAKERDMLFELTTAQESTGASFADYASLKLRYMTSLEEAVESQAPEDCVEAFKSFLHWLVTDCHRALSLESVWRAAGSIMIRTGRRNLTSDPEMRLYYEKLGASHGLTHEPMTATTQRIAALVHTVVLPERHVGKPLMLSRSQLLFGCEYVGGLRVGETCGGGDDHGLRSDGARVVTQVDTGDTFVELTVEHSKTKFRRIVTTVGTTRGEAAIPMADFLSDHWRQMGWRTIGARGAGARAHTPLSALTIG